MTIRKAASRTRFVGLGMLTLIAVAVSCPNKARVESAPTAKVTQTGIRPLDALVAAMNSGDSATIAAMVREHYAASALASPGSFERATTRWLEQFANYGPVTVDSVLQNDGRLARAWVRGDLTKAWAEFLVFADSAAPMRIARVSVGRGLLPPYVDARRRRIEASGFSPELRAFVEQLTLHDRFSGVVIVTRDGAELFGASYGLANEGRRARITRATPFNLASAGKLFTSTAIATLVRDGRLALADTIARFVPELKVGRRITVGQLLQHSSGLGELGAFFDTLSFGTAVEYLQYFADTSLAFAPGTQSQYSNRGYVVAGAVVERVTHQTFSNYLRESISRPLRMSRTDFLEPSDASSGRAVGFTYYPSVRGGFAPGARRPNTSLVRRGSPAGGSYSSAEDMLRLVEAFRTNALGNERIAIFSPETAGQFGLMLSPDRVWLGHAGGHPGVSAQAWTAPSLAMSFVVLSNYDVAANHIAQYIMDLAAQCTSASGK